MKSKMSWLKILVCVCSFWMVSANLLNYVQHINKNMRIWSHSQQIKDLPQRSRNRRSIIESSIFKVANPVNQNLDSYDKIKDKKKTSMNTEFFNSSNIPEEYYDVDVILETKEQNGINNSFSSIIKVQEINGAAGFNSVLYKDLFLKRNSKKIDFPKKYRLERNKDTFILNERLKRSEQKIIQFIRYERLDEDGDVILEWDPTDDENVTFRLTAKTLGYVGLGFNDKDRMIGADIILAWVDDHTYVPVILDSYGIKSMNTVLQTDILQNVHLIHGYQNLTHTIITFTRKWETCDPQDRSLTKDTIRVLWALHHNDPELNSARFHGTKRGSRALRLRESIIHQPSTINESYVIKWDIKFNQFTVLNTSDTVYWCKIFKAPKLYQKHHMIGYMPLVERSNQHLVHHLILYECTSTHPILTEHARLAGAHCYSPTMPKEWDSCVQPVLTWTRGSQGEWFPEHVGFPVAEHVEGSYYMLEVHYNNKMNEQVIDSSGVRLYLTPNLRKSEAGILVAGVVVSPLHMIPPQQKEYTTVGYCTTYCTNKMFDKDGINVVSVALHSHIAGQRLTLRHIRQHKELQPIVQDKHFDFDYQQSHILEREIKIIPGDELIVECVYDTRERSQPTFGGYAVHQEICLAFIMHYPRTPLVGCYSMTPVKEFFNALNIQRFKDISMEQIEKLFLSSSTESVTLPVFLNYRLLIYPNPYSNMDIIGKSDIISKGDFIDYDIFTKLIIEKPDEFKDHTLLDHMSALAWNDTALSKSIEMSLHYGKHVLFCRTRNDNLPKLASVQMFPNYTAVPQNNETNCREFNAVYSSSDFTGIQRFVFMVFMSITLLL